MFAQHSIDISARQARFSNLRERVALTRAFTEKLTEPLSDEDQTVQAMDDASPAKWHLAHTTWFFEVFVLEPYMKDYEQFDARFHYCFNSYYETAGPRHPRPKRGLLTRPAASEVRAYRRHVTGSLDRLLSNSAEYPASLAELIELGINHEQQHQELIQTDILSLFAENPLRPALHAIKTDAHWKDNSKGGLAGSSKSRKWPVFKGGIRTIGHDGEGFSYDNESPRHDVLLRPYRMAPGLVTNAD